jgi:hypothetical protein
LTYQLIICYICWDFGASDQLQRFDLYLEEDGLGGYTVKYKLKQGVPQEIGVAYYQSDQSLV